jgi:hypothetical protein
MKTFPKAILRLLTIVGLFYQQANARPIVGSIDFGGVVTYDTTSLATATRVNLWNSSFVLQDFGDFSGIAAGTNVTMAPSWTFNLGTPAMPMPGPATNGLWNVGGFTFDLTSSTVVTQNANFLNVTGTGFISSTNTNLDRTPGVWTFSSSNSSGSDHTTFGFQATTDPVPEGSTVGLLGTGGLVLASLYFFRRNRAAFKSMKRPLISPAAPIAF